MPGQTPDQGRQPDNATLVSLQSDGASLLVDWEYLDGTASGSDDAVPGLLLLTRDDAGTEQTVLYPEHVTTPAGGRFTLPFKAHRIGWDDTRLQLLQGRHDAEPTLSGDALPIGDALGASTRTLAPGVSLAGERFGDALSWTPDGRFLVVAMPLAEQLVIYRSDATGLESADSLQRIDITGLAAAVPGSIRLAPAAFAATVAISWALEDGTRRLTIAEASGEGYQERIQERQPAMPNARLLLNNEGTRLDLTDGAALHYRLERAADVWQPVTMAHVPDTVGHPHVDAMGERVHLIDRRAGPLSLLHTADGTEQPLPGTQDLRGQLVGPTTRIVLDSDSQLLALATLTGAGDTGATPTLYLFEPDQTGAWGPTGQWQAAVTRPGGDIELSIGQRPAAPADTLLWQWSAPAAAGSDPASSQPGMAVLTKAPVSDAFGSAGPSDRPPGRWGTRFMLPRDAVSLTGASPMVGAALGPDGQQLAVSRLPTAQSADLPDAAQRDDNPVRRPAGDVLLID